MLGGMDDVTTPNGPAAPADPHPTEAELAVLDGGPATGLRLRVAGRPPILQVTRPCAAEPGPGSGAFGVAEVYVYRRDWGVKRAPLRYGYDPGSP
ncbi:hypothetical protein G3I34_25970 [Streptomyces sp. SID8014]|uniref:hypothetical protein n=1 Tax=Streptomyces sp. SID8014 TaxID=2706097 RepID=UPI0013BE53A5|nr:hypothetical protein [Streptomyces sp. SID8014]NEC15654.1 hypothetical protein [Streptomyces sp. SID8014]